MVGGGASSQFWPGAILARKYRVEGLVGEGGMARVYRVVHEGLQQTFALKVLSSSADGADGRFLSEARAAAKLRTRHVARVFDVGTLEGGQPYMVMELLEGKDLEGLLAERGPLPVGECVDLVLQAVEAVAEAHARGIVHRDLKPANLFLTLGPSDVRIVKVLDFGISKDLSGESQSLTSTKSLMGSPLYMSPEQVRNAKAVDLRTDIWAFGVILYELLSGQTPFAGETPWELFSAIVNGVPRPLERALPDGLRRVIASCLERERELRPRSALELADLLAPYATNEGRSALEETRRFLASALRDSSPSFSGPSIPPPRAISSTAQGVVAPARSALTAERSPRATTVVLLGLLVALALALVAVRLVGWRAQAGGSALVSSVRAEASAAPTSDAAAAAPVTLASALPASAAAASSPPLPPPEPSAAARAPAREGPRPHPAPSARTSPAPTQSSMTPASSPTMATDRN